MDPSDQYLILFKKQRPKHVIVQHLTRPVLMETGHCQFLYFQTLPQVIRGVS